MAKFTFPEAETLLRATETQTKDLNTFIRAMMVAIRQKDPRFAQRLEGVSSGEFLGLIDFYSWFYRYFVGE